jgi:hypothetical protein
LIAWVENAGLEVFRNAEFVYLDSRSASRLLCFGDEIAELEVIAGAARGNQKMSTVVADENLGDIQLANIL